MVSQSLGDLGGVPCFDVAVTKIPIAPPLASGQQPPTRNREPARLASLARQTPSGDLITIDHPLRCEPSSTAISVGWSIQNRSRERSVSTTISTRSSKGAYSAATNRPVIVNCSPDLSDRRTMLRPPCSAPNQSTQSVGFRRCISMTSSDTAQVLERDERPMILTDPKGTTTMDLHPLASGRRQPTLGERRRCETCRLVTWWPRHP